LVDAALKALTVVVVVLVVASLVASATIVQSTPIEMVRIIIGLKDYRDIEKLRMQCVSCSLVSEIPEIRAVVVEVPKQVVDKLKSLPFVAYVEDDEEVKALQEVQWNVEMIHAPDVWTTYNVSYGDAAYGYQVTIRVAVLDTGIDYKHPDLQGAVSYCIVSLNNGKTFYRAVSVNRVG